MDTDDTVIFTYAKTAEIAAKKIIKKTSIGKNQSGLEHSCLNLNINQIIILSKGNTFLGSGILIKSKKIEIVSEFKIFA